MKLPQEVNHNVGQRFQVISAALFYAQMCIDARVAGSAGQIFPVSVRNVFSVFLNKLLRESEVDQMDNVALTALSNQEIVRLKVSVNKMLAVQEFETVQCLQSEHNDRLD